MDIKDAKSKILTLRDKLLEMQKISSWVEPGMLKEDEQGRIFLDDITYMSEAQPNKSAALKLLWEEVQKIVPSGFSIDGSLIRHLFFNEPHDWIDLAKRDIPRELTKVDEYIAQLTMIEYVETLHPEVSRISNILLIGDFDAALKTIYASLDSKIRAHMNAKDDESTVNLIAIGFKDGRFANDNSDAARNFLMGVIGYYRNNILHNKLSTSRNSLQGSLSLVTLAHEAFRVLDRCTVVKPS